MWVDQSRSASPEVAARVTPVSHITSPKPKYNPRLMNNSSKADARGGKWLQVKRSARDWDHRPALHLGFAYCFFSLGGREMFPDGVVTTSFFSFRPERIG